MLAPALNWSAGGSPASNGIMPAAGGGTTAWMAFFMALASLAVSVESRTDEQLAQVFAENGNLGRVCYCPASEDDGLPGGSGPGECYGTAGN